jgi:hypothetical protein
MALSPAGVRLPRLSVGRFDDREEPAVLEHLKDIRWNRLEDAYGSALPVPRLLRALTDGDARVREAALERLWLALCPERRSLVEASSYAVPFLVELACAEHLPGRGAILELLETMAHLAHEGAPDEREADAREAARQSLLGHHTAILGLLGDRHGDVRARAALVTGQLARTAPGLGEGLVIAVSAALWRESDPATRVAFLTVLEQHGAQETLRAALQDRSPAVLLAAALGLLAHDLPGERSFRIVGTALEAPAQAARLYGAASRYRPLALAARICAAGPMAARALLPGLLRLVAEGSAQSAERDLEPLLTTFFPRGAGHELDAEQSAVLGAVVANPRYFEAAPEVVALLRRHGLPERPRGLRELAMRGPLAALRSLPPPPAATPVEDVLARVASRQLRGRPPEELRALTLVGEASHELIAMLGAFPALTELSIKSSMLGARGLAAVAELHSLERLALEDLTLEAGWASSVASMAGLVELALIDDSFAAEELDALRRARPSLRIRVE